MQELIMRPLVLGFRGVFIRLGRIPQLIATEYANSQLTPIVNQLGIREDDGILLCAGWEMVSHT